MDDVETASQTKPLAEPIFVRGWAASAQAFLRSTLIGSIHAGSRGIAAIGMDPDDVAYTASLAVLTFFLVRPLWILRYLPLGDLPDHAGQIQALLRYDLYRSEFEVHWFSPYLVGYGITLLFAKFFPIITALKITLSLSLVAIPLGAAALLRSLGGNRYLVWTAFPVAYSFAFYWGFLNYIVAASLAIAFFALAARSAKGLQSWRCYGLLAGFSALVFVSHALAWAFSVVLATAITFIWNSPKSTIKKASAFFVVVPLVAFWMSHRNGEPSAAVQPGDYLEHYFGPIAGVVTNVANEFQNNYQKGECWVRLKQVVSYSIGLPEKWDFVVLGLAYLSWPLWIGGRLARDWKAWIPVLGTVIAFEIAPYYFLEAGYVYQRIPFFLIPASYFAFDHAWARARPPVTGKARLWRLAAYAFGFSLVLLAELNTNANFEKFRQNDADFEAVLNAMEPRKRVMALVIDGDPWPTVAPPYLHFGNWYQAEKLGIVTPGFSTSPSDQIVPLRVRGKSWAQPDTWNPGGTFDWVRHKGATYDYFLLRSNTPRPDLFKDANGTVALVEQKGAWLLYRRAAAN